MRQDQKTVEVKVQATISNANKFNGQGGITKYHLKGKVISLFPQEDGIDVVIKLT